METGETFKIRKELILFDQVVNSHHETLYSCSTEYIAKRAAPAAGCTRNQNFKSRSLARKHLRNYQTETSRVNNYELACSKKSKWKTRFQYGRSDVSPGIFRLCFCTDRECVQLSVRERNSTHVCNEHVSTELFSLCSTEGKNVSSSFSFSIISSLKFVDYLSYLSFYFVNIIPGEFVCLTDLFNSRLNSLNFCPTKFHERREVTILHGPWF